MQNNEIDRIVHTKVMKMNTTINESDLSEHVGSSDPKTPKYSSGKYSLWVDVLEMMIKDGWSYQMYSKELVHFCEFFVPSNVDTFYKAQGSEIAMVVCMAAISAVEGSNESIC